MQFGLHAGCEQPEQGPSLTLAHLWILLPSSALSSKVGWQREGAPPSQRRRGEGGAEGGPGGGGLQLGCKVNR